MDGPDLQHIPVNLPLGSQLSPAFDPNDSQPFQAFSSAIGDIEQGLSTANAFVRTPRAGDQQNSMIHPTGVVPAPRPHQVSGFESRNSNNGRFSIPPPRPGQGMTPGNSQIGQSEPGPRTLAHSLHTFSARNNELELVPSLDQPLQQFTAPESPGDKQEGHFRGMKLIPNPPDLEAWRERLFNIDEMITLTEEQYSRLLNDTWNFADVFLAFDRFQTYFPHVDNVYSHRSTQKYKRKPFISHYWDCRLKGRPPGTPKSEDPNKKKRKRTARQRDLCDVKIKITEYFAGVLPTDPELGTTIESLSADATAANPFFTNGGPSREGQPFGVLTPNPGTAPVQSGMRLTKYYTIQRVNGNGGNGKGDGVSGSHRHTLEESDRVKKNSVQRYLLKEAKDKKKTGVSPLFLFHHTTSSLQNCASVLLAKRRSRDFVDLYLPKKKSILQFLVARRQLVPQG
jgi:hypothetical protein